MNLGITVNQLRTICNKQIKKGNGNKHVLISDDDEGNGYHTLFYGFLDNSNEELKYVLELEHDRTHTVDNCVALG